MNSNKLLIFGAGETARLALEYFTCDSAYEVVAFVVDDEYKSSVGEKLMGRPVVAMSESVEVFSPVQHEAFVAVGASRMNYDRTSLLRRVQLRGYRLASYVSSRAFVWRDVVVGANCFILENNVLQSRVVVGENTILWSGNHIGHCTEIADNCFITSHVVISGFCRIGEHCFLGVNSSIANNVTISDHNYIGMGTVVNKSTEPDSIYSGNPAEKSRASAKRFCKV